MKKALSILLSLCLGLFLVDGFVSLADASLVLLTGNHLLTIPAGMLFPFSFLLTLMVYVLMAFTPMIPRRLFLPLVVFNLGMPLAIIPFLIYSFDRIMQLSWVISLMQVMLGLFILWRLQGGFRPRWPWVTDRHLVGRPFSWLNLSLFLLVNLFGLLPAAVIYLVLCAALAVDHCSDGFLALRPQGLLVQVRKYGRDDGRTIQLIPMTHIGDASFYRQAGSLIPTNAIILMEGVTDEKNLLTNKPGYKRAATSLGLAEQEEEFAPVNGEPVLADLDVEEFSTNTIHFLNLIMLFHARGVNPETMQQALQYSPPPNFEKQFFNDVLHKRNRHLLEEIDARLSESEYIVVPWGVAHMPEIAEGIQKSGFHLDETRRFTLIHFGAGRHKTQRVTKEAD